MNYRWKIEEGTWDEFRNGNTPYIGKVLYQTGNSEPIMSEKNPYLGFFDAHVGLVIPNTPEFGRIGFLTYRVPDCRRKDPHNCRGIDFHLSCEKWHGVSKCSGASLGIEPYHGWIRHGYLIIDKGCDILPENHGGEAC